MEEVNDSKHVFTIMQAAMPYFNSNIQNSFSVIIKLEEMKDTIKNLNNQDSVSACSFENSKMDIENMLNSIRDVCYDSEKEMLDLFLNFIKAQKFYKAYETATAILPDSYSHSQTTKANSTSNNSKPDTMNILKNMLPPEQQSSFDNISMMLNLMNTTNN